MVANSAVAQPVSIPHKGADGSDKGTAKLSLKVAEDTAKAVVHRYMVMVQQNARRVRNGAACSSAQPPHLSGQGGRSMAQNVSVPRHPPAIGPAAADCDAVACGGAVLMAGDSQHPHPQ